MQQQRPPTHNKALNVYSRFHLIAIQIAVPFIKRTIKSSFAICDTRLRAQLRWLADENIYKLWGLDGRRMLNYLGHSRGIILR